MAFTTPPPACPTPTERLLFLLQSRQQAFLVGMLSGSDAMVWLMLRGLIRSLMTHAGGEHR